MTDFLTRLAQRQVDPRPGVAPRLPSRFEPGPVEAPPPDDSAGYPPVSPAPAPAPSARTEPRRATAPGDATSDGAPAASQPLSGDEVRAPGALPRPQPAAPVPTGKAHVPRPLPPTRQRDPGPLVAASLPASKAPPRDAGPFQVRPAAATPPDPVSAVQPLRPQPPPAPEPLVPRTGPPVPPPPVAYFEREAPATEPAGPIAHVTIGRLEVRADAAPEPARGDPAPPKHRAISLDEYLDDRDGARR